jgi:hypothetical protein
MIENISNALDISVYEQGKFKSQYGELYGKIKI